MVYIALICKEYKWTYEEYMSQPVDFLDAIEARRTVEAQKAEEDNDKMQREMKSIKSRK